MEEDNFIVIAAICGIKKVRYVKNDGKMGMGKKTGKGEKK